LSDRTSASIQEKYFEVVTSGSVHRIVGVTVSEVGGKRRDEKRQFLFLFMRCGAPVARAIPHSLTLS
jgi:hypothetical protein